MQLIVGTRFVRSSLVGVTTRYIIGIIHSVSRSRGSCPCLPATCVSWTWLYAWMLVCSYIQLSTLPSHTSSRLHIFGSAFHSHTIHPINPLLSSLLFVVPTMFSSISVPPSHIFLIWPVFTMHAILTIGRYIIIGSKWLRRVSVNFSFGGRKISSIRLYLFYICI